jgi:uncharacterized protein (DUF2147 family)
MRLLLAGLMLSALLAAPAARADTQDAAGTWSMGKVTVKVSECGGNLCAKIVALAEPISKIDGKPKVDRENEDASKRKRPLIGLTVMNGMKPAGEGTWKGQIYNPDDGKTYSATVRLSGDRMKVQGCVLGVLCKTNNFARVD